MVWHKACQKKSFLSPNWLRDIKNKSYSKFRIDTIFSRKKYSNVNFISDGGWHFTNIKTPEEVQKISELRTPSRFLKKVG